MSRRAVFLTMSLCVMACGGAPPRPARVVASSVEIAEARRRVDALRAGPGHAALEAALERVDPDDPIAVLSAVDPLLEPDAAADEHMLALLVAALASHELGMPLVVAARLSEVMDSGAPELRAAASTMVATGLAGADPAWSDYLRRLTVAEVDDALAAAPSTRARDMRLAVANAYEDIGEWTGALRVLAVPTLDQDPEARWSRALCRLALRDEASARPDLDFVAASQSAWSGPARVLLARYRILEANEARMTVYDSPFFHGDAAHAILADALGPLETIAPTSPAYLAAIDARTMMLYWCERTDEAALLWLSVPAERRIFAAGRFSRVAAWDARDADPQGACSTYLATQAAVARAAAWIAALPAEPPPDMCPRIASLPREAIDSIVPLATEYYEPIDPSEWRFRDPLASLIAHREIVTESAARLAELPETFRNSHAGQRAVQDIVVASAFFDWGCLETARGAVARAEDRAREVGEDLVALGLDPTRCGSTSPTIE